jgi:hypothetical protein
MSAFTNDPAFKIMWQLAIVAAIIHIIVKKIPQQPDTALTIFSSALYANTLSVTILIYSWQSITSSICLAGVFNITFVHTSRLASANYSSLWESFFK